MVVSFMHFKNMLELGEKASLFFLQKTLTATDSPIAVNIED
jgi:hypothetical protein